MKITKNDIINFWVDYIEIVWESQKIKDLRFINTWEENYLTFPDLFPWFKIRKTHKVMNYEYKIVFKKDWFDCFAYHKWQQNWIVETTDFLSVYWVAFKVFENLAEIIDFVNANLIVDKLRRFDLAVDIWFDVSEIYNNVNIKNRKSTTFTNNDWKLQTFYIWEKKKAQNRYKLFRCYNKIDDIKRTNRQRLYPDYLLKDKVSRIELEIRSELCWDVLLNSLLDRKYIFDIFLSYMKQYTDIFKWFEYDEIKLSHLNKIISLDDLIYDKVLKLKYLKNFLWYWRTILEIWICPVNILIRNWYIWDLTKKDIILSIKNWVFRQDLYEFWLNKRYSKDPFRDDDDFDDTVYISNNDDYD